MSGVETLKLIDPNFKQNYKKYIFQCALAAAASLLIFLLVDMISSMIILASFGASAFIAFTMPLGYAAKPRNMIGGYFCGSVTGLFFYFLYQLMIIHVAFQYIDLTLVILSALCVGITSFVMVLMDMEHPPAVGMALGLVINEWTYLSITITLLAIIALSIMREALKKHLINLK